MLARFSSTHPDPGQRARHARELIEQLETVPTRTGEESLRRIAARVDR